MSDVGCVMSNLFRIVVDVNLKYFLLEEIIRQLRYFLGA